MFNRNSKIKKYTNSGLFDELTADVSDSSDKSNEGWDGKVSQTFMSDEDSNYTITTLFDSFKESTRPMISFSDYRFGA